MRKLLAFPLLLILLLESGVSARAQSKASADLYPPDVSSFPTISALLDVFDSNGIFASGLTPESVTVMEDGQPLPAAELMEQAVPLQIVVAVNPGPPLDARDTQGLSRFQRVAQVLAGWAQLRPADPADDISLVGISGPVISHAAAKDFIAGLSSYQPDFRATTPNLQSLSIAIDTVLAQTPRAGMKRAILFITPHMDDANIASAIQPYIQRAVENRIRVFVWFVDAELYFITTSTAAFNTLALETGGSLFAFSGVEPFPDPESYFSPLRRIYTLKYTSRLSAGGEHKISVQVDTPAGKINSLEQVFNVDIQPPNPILVSPPLQITRQAPPDDPFNTEILLPEQQEIEIIVEFPDRHPRALARTTLYVDGQVVDENTSEPFDKFTWDLTSYNLSGEHQIIVEAVDELGLSKVSMEIPVVLTIIQPPRGPTALLAKYRQPITYGAIALAGLALLFVLLTGRLRIPTLRAIQAKRREYEDPLTQPVKAVTQPPPPAKEKRRSPRKTAPTVPRSAAASNAPASLLRLNADGQPATANPIPLIEKEVTIGTDPVQCNHVLDDPSLSPLHARLKRTDEGIYLLSDNNSTAGTWVNYEPVPREGYRLAHGDVVHFGQLKYRFTLRTPPKEIMPKVTPQTPEE